MASSSTTVIASGALVLAGCAVGLLLGRWTAAPAQAAERTGDAPAAQDSAPILAELRKLNETLQLEHQRSHPVPASPDRETAAPRSDLADRLETAVARMEGVLKTASDRLGRTNAAIQSSKGAGFPSLDALFQRRQALADGGVVSGLGGGPAFQGELMQLHRLWSREDLIERYGVPSFMGGGAERGLMLTYTRPKSPNEYETVNFATIDDVVTGGWGN
jgi:hypothetical protein